MFAKAATAAAAARRRRIYSGDDRQVSAPDFMHHSAVGGGMKGLAAAAGRRAEPISNSLEVRPRATACLTLLGLWRRGRNEKPLATSVMKTTRPVILFRTVLQIVCIGWACQLCNLSLFDFYKL